jgi:hypothetical protein
MYGEAVGRLAGSVQMIHLVGGQLQAARINKGEIMVRNIGKLFLVLCLLTIGGGVGANAQVGTVPEIEVNVPFDFMVGDTRLPAGKYQIRSINEASDKVLEIRSANSRTSVLFDTEDAENRGELVKNKTQLVFDKVGDEHFLFQIWVEGSASGNELGKSRMEKRLMDGGNQAAQQPIVASLKRLKP